MMSSRHFGLGVALASMAVGLAGSATAGEPRHHRGGPAPCFECGRVHAPTTAPHRAAHASPQAPVSYAPHGRPYAALPGLGYDGEGLPPLPESQLPPGVLGEPVPEGMVPGVAAPSPLADAVAAEPSAVTPFAPGAPAAPGLAPAAGLGGGLAGGAGALVMFGDQAPIFGPPIVPPLPPTPPRPPFPPEPPIPPTPQPAVPIEVLAEKGRTMIPWIRSFKIADNQSPIPQDRVFFNFNYFDDVNDAINRRFNAPIFNINAYRYQLGFEKTFLDGNASLGLRDSINTLSSESPIPALGGTSTAMGDLNIFGKYVFWQAWEPGGFADPDLLNGGLISGGLSLTAPTGPSQFAGARFSRAFRNTRLQPFGGYYFTRGNFYLHGFEAIDVPLDRRDVTMLYNDVGLGYFLYRSPRPDSLITAIAPTFEVHVNVPLNNRDVFNILNPVGTADVVDLTYGLNVLLGRRSLLSFGMVTPITGPRPFDYEVLAMLNVYFGGPRRPPRLATAPPVLGM